MNSKEMAFMPPYDSVPVLGSPVCTDRSSRLFLMISGLFQAEFVTHA